MGAVGSDAPIKIVLTKKYMYTAIVPIEIRTDICTCMAPGMWTVPPGC